MVALSQCRFCVAGYDLQSPAWRGESMPYIALFLEITPTNIRKHFVHESKRALVGSYGHHEVWLIMSHMKFESRILACLKFES